MKSRTFSQDVFVEGLPEIILGEGDHSFKLIFNPKKYKNCHEMDITVLGPSDSVVPSHVDRWGTKMRVHLSLGPEQPEGVCAVVIKGMPRSDEDTLVVKFWFVR